MTASHTFAVTLTLRAPFIFRGLAQGASGLDMAQIRNERGAPIIPAEQVRGVVREAIHDLVEVGAVSADTVSLWFGAPSDERAGREGEADRPNRSRLVFADFVADKMQTNVDGAETTLPAPGSVDTTRVMIDDETGTVSRGALQVIELVAPFAALVRFTGEIIAFAPTEDAGSIVRALKQAFALVSSIGSMKSAGFGEVISVDVRPLRAPKPLALPSSPASGPARRMYRISFDRPVLVDSERIADNAFQGSAILPGAVFKAALARRIEISGERADEGELGSALSALSISHAMPESDEEGRHTGEPLPLSVVAAKGADGVVFRDASAITFGKGVMIGSEPAYFQPDWKGNWQDAASEIIGRPYGLLPPLIARTHTAIQNGVAKDGQLFTTIARAARRSGKDDRPFTWLVTVDASECADDVLGRRLLSALEEGLSGVGKTDAHATFEFVGEGPKALPRPVVGQGRRHIVVLTSDAMLIDPVASTTDDGSRWALTAQDAYSRYWAKVLPGSVLANLFTQEAWVGGYLSFRRRPYGGESYHPFLVTKAGSTFVLDDADPVALGTLCARGLPLPELRHADPLDWRTCPFVRENGYARIRADHCGDERTARLLEGVSGV